ncbi:MAG: hypothetical protein FD130_1903 [Halothiobacillaceae bacterium]|nr:MAG: hypothetical protein FD130_1903 [Halothiobacillaceae bacterium]
MVYAFDLSPSARAAVKALPRTVTVGEDDILEIEVEGGLTLWISAQRYQARVALWHPEAISERGLELVGLPGPSVAERGVKEWFAGALRVLRLKADDIAEQLKDPNRWVECVKDLALKEVEKVGAWATTKLLIYLIEKRLTPGPGLYRWAAVDSATPLALDHATPLSADDLPTDRPILVFIHGMTSRTLGCFGAFCNSEASQEWSALQAMFGEHIYAFEHRTMSESPIDNAITLAGSLPVGAQLYLVTSSQGGLVGDLLCCGDAALDDLRIDRFKRSDLLQQKRLQVKRLARVACPARGTLLVSDNIDEFLSLLTNLIGYIPVVGQSPIYQVIKRITLEVVKGRIDPTLIPGIEAMMPASPLVALLNSVTEAQGELGVIAGDIEGGNWFKRIALFITDRFIYEQRDNDLVVNTDSMFHGARHTVEYYLFDQGAEVSHFNYFHNTHTRVACTRWLLAPAGQPPQEFTPFIREHIEPVAMQRALVKSAGKVQPTLFIVPGFMGSQLQRGEEKLWVNYQDLLAGGLTKIEDVHAKKITATALLGDYYGALCDYMAQTHEVQPFAYDWRNSIRRAATELGKEVSKVLQRNGQPVRFIAHGMGGLVVRRFIFDHPTLWEQLCARPGSRCILLGTPNHGSHATVELLLGAASSVRQLALLDREHALQQVVDLFAGFPGLLELLPQQVRDGSDFNGHSATAWRRLNIAAHCPQRRC